MNFKNLKGRTQGPRGPHAGRKLLTPVLKSCKTNFSEFRTLTLEFDNKGIRFSSLLIT